MKQDTLYFKHTERSLSAWEGQNFGDRVVWLSITRTNDQNQSSTESIMLEEDEAYRLLKYLVIVNPRKLSLQQTYR